MALVNTKLKKNEEIRFIVQDSGVMQIAVKKKWEILLVPFISLIMVFYSLLYIIELGVEWVAGRIDGR